MIVVDEQTVRETVGIEAVIEAVRAVFIAEDAEDAENYPVVRNPLGHRDAVFGIKSGFERGHGVLGLKAGGYWPQNAAGGIANHQSTVLLFDVETGKPSALVAAGYLTALRTAAASALAAQALARPDSRVLAVIGAGDQAWFQIEAIAKLLSIERVVIANRTMPRAEALAARCREAGFDATTATPDDAVAQADIVVTITSAKAPLFAASAARPGTHVCAMGADTRGKQELALELVASSSVFADNIEQAVTLGECQHAHAAGLLPREAIRGTLGGLLSGRQAGRGGAGEVTIFDGTGIGLQDLAAAALAVETARAEGRAVEVAI